MAWNGSDNPRVGASPAPRKPHVALKGAAAGLLVTLLGAGVVFFVTRPSAPGKKKGTAAPAPIAEVKPAAPAKKAEAPKPKKYTEMTNAEKLKSIRDRYGDNIPDNLKSVVYFLEHPVREDMKFKARAQEYDIFKFSSERDIASLLVVEPGDFFLRKPTYDEQFDRDFGKSLSETIEFTPDDTPRQRELKQAVIDTKGEIAERMRAGEKPSDILNAAADQMYELGAYKEELKTMLTKIRADEQYSDQDVQDFVTAANEMLEKKGASPLPMPNLVFRQAKLRAAAQKAAAESEDTVE